MNDNELIIQLLTQMQTSFGAMQVKMDNLQEDIKEIKVGQERLEKRMDGFEERMDRFEARMDGFEERQNRLEARMDGLEKQQDALMQTMINMENELKPRVTALFDAFELRGDQIGNLRAEIHQEFSSIKLDINYMLSKVVQYNGRFESLERARG